MTVDKIAAERRRPAWDEYFLGFAAQAAVRSDCLRAQVGAVIVNTRRKVKGAGYDNSPTGVESCLARHFETFRRLNVFARKR